MRYQLCPSLVTSKNQRGLRTESLNIPYKCNENYTFGWGIVKNIGWALPLGRELCITPRSFDKLRMTPQNPRSRHAEALEA